LSVQRREKDTVAEKNENDEVDTEHHAVSLDSALRLDCVKHHFVPVFTSQYLTTQFTSHLLSALSYSGVYCLSPEPLNQVPHIFFFFRFFYFLFCSPFSSVIFRPPAMRSVWANAVISRC